MEAPPSILVHVCACVELHSHHMSLPSLYIQLKGRRTQLPMAMPAAEITSSPAVHCPVRHVASPRIFAFASRPHGLALLKQPHLPCGIALHLASTLPSRRSTPRSTKLSNVPPSSDPTTTGEGESPPTPAVSPKPPGTAVNRFFFPPILLLGSDRIYSDRFFFRLRIEQANQLN